MYNSKEGTTTQNLIDEMTNVQLSRWSALVDGVNVIAINADKVGRRWDNIYIKQPALEDYVERTCVLIYREITGNRIL